MNHRNVPLCALLAWLIVTLAPLYATAQNAPPPAAPRRAALRARLDVFSDRSGTAAQTSIAVRPTALMGVPIDAEVVERLLRARMQDVQGQVLRDLLTGDLSTLQQCKPCQDFFTTLAALTVQTMDADARSAAVTTATLRVGASFSLGALGAPGAPLGPPAGGPGPAGSCAGPPDNLSAVVERANAAYVGLQHSTWMRTLGFPSECRDAADCSSTALPTSATGCAAFSLRIQRLADTIARLGTDLQGIPRVIEAVEEMRRDCRGPQALVPGFVELNAAIRAITADVAAGRARVSDLREVRNAFTRARGELTSFVSAVNGNGTRDASVGEDQLVCVRALQRFQTVFDDTIGRLAADVGVDATLRDLHRNVLSIIDPASHIPDADLSGDANAERSVARAQALLDYARSRLTPLFRTRLASYETRLSDGRARVLRDCVGHLRPNERGRDALLEFASRSLGEALTGDVSAPESDDRACSSALDAALRDAREVGDEFRGLLDGMQVAPNVAPLLRGSARTQYEDLRVVFESGVRRCPSLEATLRQSVRSFANASPDAGVTDALGDAQRGELQALSTGLQQAIRTTGAAAPSEVCRASMLTMNEAIQALPASWSGAAPNTTLSTWLGSLPDDSVVLGLRDASGREQPLTLANLDDAIYKGLFPQGSAQGHAILDRLGTALDALQHNADVVLVRDLAMRLANQQPLRRVDIVAMAGRIRIHLEPMLTELARDDARWNLVKRLVLVVLDAIPQAIVEDEHTPGGLRLDVPALVSTLTSEFAQQDRQGVYIRATIGAGYVIQSDGSVTRPFYEEVGVGYRRSVWNNRLLMGPHLAVSGLLYQLQDFGHVKEPLFVGVGWSVNFYRLLDVSASLGALFDVGDGGVAPRFAFTVGLQLPLADYIAALASGSGVSATTTTRGGASQ